MRRFRRSQRCKLSSQCSAVFAYAPDTPQFASIAAQAAATLQMALPAPIALQGFASKDSLFATINNNASFTLRSRVVLSAIFDAVGGYQILIDGSDVDIFSTSNAAQTCRAYWGSLDPNPPYTASSPFESGYANCPPMDYFQSIFVAAQVAIDSELFSATFTPTFYAAPLQKFQQYLGEGVTSFVPLCVRASFTQYFFVTICACTLSSASSSTATYFPLPSSPRKKTKFVTACA